VTGTDSGGGTQTSMTITVDILCGPSSTSLSVDSAQMSSGARYRTFSCLETNTAGSAKYYFHDFINSLVNSQPSTSCVTNVRGLSSSSSSFVQHPDFDHPPTIMTNGNYEIVFNGDVTMPGNYNFYLYGEAVGGEYVLSSEVGLHLVCATTSNTVTPPTANTTTLNITGPYTVSFDPFTQTNPNCGYMNIEIYNHTMNVYDGNSNLISSTYLSNSGATLVDNGSDIQVTFPNHCDAMRRHTF
jgi:hypothetical protein